jgi:hypothetical protein
MGDILVWATLSLIDQGWDIWGVNVPDGKPLPLVIGPGNQQAPAIAGNMLAWHDDGSAIVSQTATGIMSLQTLFATAPDRLRELERLLPPRPTPPLNSPTLLPTLPPGPHFTPTP